MSCFLIFFFNDTATTEIYTLSLHDALPISEHEVHLRLVRGRAIESVRGRRLHRRRQRSREGLQPSLPLRRGRSGEHTSELPSQSNLLLPPLPAKKKHPESPAPTTFTPSRMH